MPCVARGVRSNFVRRKVGIIYFPGVSFAKSYACMSDFYCFSYVLLCFVRHISSHTPGLAKTLVSLWRGQLDALFLSEV